MANHQTQHGDARHPARLAAHPLQGAAAPRNGAAMVDPFDAPPGPDYDALADLFLGDSDAPAPSPAETTKAAGRVPGPVLKVVSGEEEDSEDAEPSATAPPPLIEGLIIGHLPVLASAWATQYARHLAEESGGWVGLIKLRAGQCSVEIVGPARGEASPGVAARDTLEGGIDEAARVAGRWLLRVDELTEVQLAELPGLDAATLLTGADEAAVVASYRTLKLLAERAGADDRAPQLGVAIMGASPERAREAAAKLARTVEVYLGRSLPLAACIARIGPGRSIALYRAELRESADTLLPRIIWGIRLAAQRARSRPAEALPPAPSGAPAPPAPAAPPAAPVPVTPANAAAPPAPPPMTPQPAGDQLAGHIAGLRPLPATCPYAPGVELSVDAAGRVHVLARMDAGDGQVLGHLLAASAWAASHAEWIRLAWGGAVVDGEAVMHVFSEEPRGARRLLDSKVRVHLLARVRLGDREGWVCRDLN